MRPLIEENAFLQKAMTDTDTAGLKRIEGSYLYLRGMRSPIGIKSVPADMIVFDELDEATPDAKTRAKERLSHIQLQARDRAQQSLDPRLRHR